MGGGHRPGTAFKVLCSSNVQKVVRFISEEVTISVSFDKQEDADYFQSKIGVEGVVSFSFPAGGDMAGEASTEPQSGD